jgi:hypothetical protein
MIAQPSLERCQTFINCQLQPAGKLATPAKNGEHWRAVTISRQTGSGAHVVGEELASYLQAHSPKDACPWTVFDRNLVEKVLEEHHLPERMARFLAEDRISELQDTMDELFGLHPPSWTLVRQTADTILHLAELGHAVIIGRGANIITRKLDYVFHVRLVAPLENRIQYLQQLERLSDRAAREFVRKEDLGRRRYVKKYFGKDIEDPLLYHLTVNTGLLSYEKAARVIGEAVVGPPK